MMSSAVHDVALYVCCKACVWYGGLWGEEVAEHADLAAAAAAEATGGV